MLNLARLITETFLCSRHILLTVNTQFVCLFSKLLVSKTCHTHMKTYIFLAAAAINVSFKCMMRWEFFNFSGNVQHFVKFLKTRCHFYRCKVYLTERIFFSNLGDPFLQCDIFVTTTLADNINSGNHVRVCGTQKEFIMHGFEFNTHTGQHFRLNDEHIMEMKIVDFFTIFSILLCPRICICYQFILTRLATVPL